MGEAQANIPDVVLAPACSEIEPGKSRTVVAHDIRRIAVEVIVDVAPDQRRQGLVSAAQSKGAAHVLHTSIASDPCFRKITLRRRVRHAGRQTERNLAVLLALDPPMRLPELEWPAVRILIGVLIDGVGKGVAQPEHDLVTGLPREVIVTDTDIREAMAKSIRVIAEATKEVIEKTPPELISDMMHRGIALVGGGSFLRGIDKVLEVETKIPVHIAEDPLTAVVRGCGVILEDLNNLTDVLVEHEEELPPI